MVDLKALQAILEQLEETRNIPKEKLIEAIEMALSAAYKKDFGRKGQIINCRFDIETGDIEFSQIKIAVDESIAKPESSDETGDSSTDERFRFDPEKHIWLEDARRIKRNVSLEEEITFPLDTEDDFGRIAAQTAKQVIIQKIREAEKSAIMDEYADKEGEIITGIVQKVDGRSVIVDFNRATGIMPASEQVPNEFYRTGQRIRALLVAVEDSNRGVNLRLSRSHPKFIEELFKAEAPEIATGTVEIKAIAREPGSRSKIAVWSNDENIDAIGACVGQKGIRVVTVMSELGGEKVDIIPWSPDDLEFVASSLSPAKVLSIQMNDEDRTALIEVMDDQLSLAIGKGGQNVRLAAKLTGWRIDIKGVNEPENSEEANTEESASKEETENEE